MILFDVVTVTWGVLRLADVVTSSDESLACTCACLPAKYEIVASEVISPSRRTNLIYLRSDSKSVKEYGKQYEKHTCGPSSGIIPFAEFKFGLELNLYLNDSWKK